MVFDDDDGLWRVEARRGHGPHGGVDDAPTARRIALVLGERPMWWSPEKDAGTKMQVSQVRGEEERGLFQHRTPTSRAGRGASGGCE